MIILFPTKEEVSKLYNSLFRGGVLYPDRAPWVNLGSNKLNPIEEDILSDIEETVLLVNKRVADLINEIPFPNIAKKYRYENSFTNWRDRSHFIRLCLEMLNKDVDEDVLSIMGLMEIFYLSWLIADEAIDKSEKCEDKDTTYSKEGQIAPILISEIIHTVKSNVFKRIVRNKKHDVDIIIKMEEIFARMWDETRYGFYLDEKSTKKLDGIDPQLLDIEEMNYFSRIEFVWGSHFEGGIKMVLSLFPDVSDEKSELLGKVGRLWGKMLKLRDDIVDIIGDREGLGRAPCEDIIRENNIIKVKMTSPVIEILKSEKRKEIISKLSEEGASGIKELEILTEILTAISTSIERLQSIASEIEGYLMKFPDNKGKLSFFKLLKLASTIRS